MNIPVHGVILRDIVRDLEVAYIRSALKMTAGNIASAAQLLGLRRTTLCSMMVKYGLKR